MWGAVFNHRERPV